MDLQGSLVDTKLKIIPSHKLIKFLKTLPASGDIPTNIKKITQKYEMSSNNDMKKKIKPVVLSSEDIENLNKIKILLKKIDLNSNIDTNDVKNNIDLKNIGTVFNNDQNEKAKHEQQNSGDGKFANKESRQEISEKIIIPAYLTTSDIDWLYAHLQERRINHEADLPYLHSLLEGSSIMMPENEMIKRNPILEERCKKLRAQQEAREYRKMTKGVDNVRMRFPEDSIAYQLKSINRQLIAIGQFIISIFAGFLFGFRGVEWMVGNLDFGFRLLLGVMCALIIALAEIYFLAKKLNEELNVPETVQLGGPPKFVNEPTCHGHKIPKMDSKEHVD